MQGSRVKTNFTISRCDRQLCNLFPLSSAFMTCDLQDAQCTGSSTAPLPPLPSVLACPPHSQCHPVDTRTPPCRRASSANLVPMPCPLTVGRYADLTECMDSISLEELIMAVRRQSQGFSRGTSAFRGVTTTPPVPSFLWTTAC